MKIYAKLILSVLFVIILFGGCWSVHQTTKIVDIKQGEGVGGIWKTKVEWKAHWVKHWEIRKVWVPIWRKVWGPREIKEWIPFPKPSPTWIPPRH